MHLLQALLKFFHWFTLIRWSHVFINVFIPLYLLGIFQPAFEIVNAENNWSYINCLKYEIATAGAYYEDKTQKTIENTEHPCYSMTAEIGGAATSEKYKTEIRPGVKALKELIDMLTLKELTVSGFVLDKGQIVHVLAGGTLNCSAYTAEENPFDADMGVKHCKESDSGGTRIDNVCKSSLTQKNVELLIECYVGGYAEWGVLNYNPGKGSQGNDGHVFYSHAKKLHTEILNKVIEVSTKIGTAQLKGADLGGTHKLKSFIEELPNKNSTTTLATIGESFKGFDYPFESMAGEERAIHFLAHGINRVLINAIITSSFLYRDDLKLTHWDDLKNSDSKWNREFFTVWQQGLFSDFLPLSSFFATNLYMKDHDIKTENGTSPNWGVVNEVLSEGTTIEMKNISSTSGDNKKYTFDITQKFPWGSEKSESTTDIGKQYWYGSNAFQKAKILNINKDNILQAEYDRTKKMSQQRFVSGFLGRSNTKSGYDQRIDLIKQVAVEKDNSHTSMKGGYTSGGKYGVVSQNNLTQASWYYMQQVDYLQKGKSWSNVGQQKLGKLSPNPVPLFYIDMESILVETINKEHISSSITDLWVDGVIKDENYLDDIDLLGEFKKLSIIYSKTKDLPKESRQNFVTSYVARMLHDMRELDAKKKNITQIKAFFHSNLNRFLAAGSSDFNLVHYYGAQDARTGEFQYTHPLVYESMVAKMNLPINNPEFYEIIVSKYVERQYWDEQTFLTPGSLNNVVYPDKYLDAVGSLKKNPSQPLQFAYAVYERAHSQMYTSATSSWLWGGDAYVGYYGLVEMINMYRGLILSNARIIDADFNSLWMGSMLPNGAEVNPFDTSKAVTESFDLSAFDSANQYVMKTGGVLMRGTCRFFALDLVKYTRLENEPLNFACETENAIWVQKLATIIKDKTNTVDKIARVYKDRALKFQDRLLDGFESIDKLNQYKKDLIIFFLEFQQLQVSVSNIASLMYDLLSQINMVDAITNALVIIADIAMLLMGIGAVKTAVKSAFKGAKGKISSKIAKAFGFSDEAIASTSKLVSAQKEAVEKAIKSLEKKFDDMIESFPDDQIKEMNKGLDDVVSLRKKIDDAAGDADKLKDLQGQLKKEMSKLDSILKSNGAKDANLKELVDDIFKQNKELKRVQSKLDSKLNIKEKVQTAKEFLSAPQLFYDNIPNAARDLVSTDNHIFKRWWKYSTDPWTKYSFTKGGPWVMFKSGVGGAVSLLRIPLRLTVGSTLQVAKHAAISGLMMTWYGFSKLPIQAFAVIDLLRVGFAPETFQLLKKYVYDGLECTELPDRKDFTYDNVFEESDQNQINAVMRDDTWAEDFNHKFKSITDINILQLPTMMIALNYYGVALQLQEDGEMEEEDVEAEKSKLYGLFNQLMQRLAQINCTDPRKSNGETKAELNEILTVDPVNLSGITYFAGGVRPGESGEKFTIASVIRMGIRLILLFISGISIIGVMYGGFLYTQNAGDDGMQDKARKTITFSLIGLVLTFLAYLIVAVIQGIIYAI